jgi:DNA-binding GntR family transcriptional regulator
MSSPRPVYRRIADELRARIDSGELPPGAQVPTQQELVEQYGVARMTVRQALKVLENDGLVVSRRPQGLFVRDRAKMTYRPQAEFQRAPSDVMDRFMAAITSEGRSPSQTIEVSLVNAPAEVAQRLRVQVGATIVARRRVRWINGDPFNLNDSYYPLDLVNDSEIMSPDDVPRGTNQVLSDLGHHQVRAIDEIYVRMPTPEQIRRLELGPGTPVAVHLCTGYTADDRPVRCTVNVLPGDRHVILYERIRPDDSSTNGATTAAATWG